MRKLAHCLGLFVVVLGLAAPAFADRDWLVSFTFSGRGRRPNPETMRNYMMGCLPAGSWVPDEDLPERTGPFNLTTPRVNHRELSAHQIHNYLSHCNLKPKTVDTIDVDSDE